MYVHVQPTHPTSQGWALIEGTLPFCTGFSRVEVPEQALDGDTARLGIGVVTGHSL